MWEGARDVCLPFGGNSVPNEFSHRRESVPWRVTPQKAVVLSCLGCCSLISGDQGNLVFFFLSHGECSCKLGCQGLPTLGHVAETAGHFHLPRRRLGKPLLGWLLELRVSEPELKIKRESVAKAAKEALVEEALLWTPEDAFSEMQEAHIQPIWEEGWFSWLNCEILPCI